MPKLLSMKSLLCTVIAVAVALTGCAQSAKQPQQTVTNATTDPATVLLTEHRIPGPGGEGRLYLREKVPANKQNFGAADVVLFLEPFGVPSAEAFDVPGFSWMEDLASKGFSTWALDIRGFGESTRPAAMEKPPLENPPSVRASEAVQDVDAAVEFIKKTRNAGKINIVGWSWGGVVAAMYAAAHPDKVNKLVLYGAMHGFSLPSMTKPLEESPGVLKATLPAYQLATYSMTQEHWNMMMHGRELATPEAIAAVGKVFMQSDPSSQSREPNSIRRPMGPLVDLYYIWSNKPIFDASQIKSPALLIRGDADFFADPTFLGKLTGTTQKKEVVIKDATHWVLYEKNRGQLLSETLQFLNGR